MNERIRERANEAGWPTYNPDGITTKLEKFAELIGRECAKALDEKLANPNGASMAYCDGSDLLEYFGVKE